MKQEIRCPFLAVARYPRRYNCGDGTPCVVEMGEHCVFYTIHLERLTESFDKEVVDEKVQVARK